jgi:hypothetical protein
MIREWEDRLAFFQRHNPPADPQIRRSEKILGLLRKQEMPAAKVRWAV